MTEWQIHHRNETESTNRDARGGVAGEVFTADFQTAGRGRLDHRWQSPPKVNLLMSAVLGVSDAAPEKVATLPLVVGYAVLQALRSLTISDCFRLKWPNDILYGGRKISGILCERHDDTVIAGIGVNVLHQQFSPELSGAAIALAECEGVNAMLTVAKVRDAILSSLSVELARWRKSGLKAIYDELVAVDFLRGKRIRVWQTDDDASPISGCCEGIQTDGSLMVGGVAVYAGEAHVDLSASR